MISDEKNEQNKKAALKLLAETNKAMGIPEVCNRVRATVGSVDLADIRGRVQLLLTEFHRLKAATVGATLYADVWKAWKARTWK